MITAAICIGCGRSFEAKKSHAEACSVKCSSDAHKRSIVFGSELLAEIRAEADNRGMAYSQFIQICVRRGLPAVRELPGVTRLPL